MEPYAALSHCWGPSPFLQTRTTNLTQHRTGIAPAALPQTFREAVDATRRLGLRRLWIDSLCIVQDDPRDWQAEAARIAAVYRGARLVLCASQAAGAHAGLYSDAAGAALFAPHVEDKAMGQVVFCRTYAHMPSSLEQQLQAAPAFPTLARGWILQERLLAARVLHFGPHELHWECMASSVCQCRDSADPATTTTKADFGRAHWQSLSPHQRSVSWHRLVETYTALRLSFATDVFSTLSGLAQTLQGVTRSRYLAGLWQDSLVLDLMWHAQPPSVPSSDTGPRPWQHRPRTWRAPSWSWAATTTPVAYLDTRDGVDPFCQVFEAAVRHVGGGCDDTGEVAAGYLVLQDDACRSPVRVRPPPDGLLARYSAWNLLQLDVLQTHVANVWADYDCRLEDDVPPMVLCFLLGQCIPSGALVMLMLKLVDSGADMADVNVYQRIGIVQVSKPPSSQSSLEYWRCVFSSEQLILKII